TATFGSTSLVSSGSDDIFIAKLSSSGSWQWVVKAGGSSTDYGFGIAVDADGFVHLTGEFIGTGDFRDDSLTSAGGTDVFVWCTFPGPIITSVSPDSSNPDGNITATITGEDLQWLNQTFSKNITVTNSGSSTLNNHVITVEDPLYNESGLVGSWHFDESSGTVVDTSGNGNNATAYGGPTYGAAGIDGAAMGFDGYNEYLKVPDNDSLDLGTGDFTLSAWVKPEEIINYDMILHNGVLSLKYTSSTWSANFGESGGPVYMTSYGPELDEWVLATLVRDSSGITPMIYFYLDGVEIYTTTSTGANLTNTEPLYIGADEVGSLGGGGMGDFLEGSLDELKIYNRALSDAEILSQYQSNSMRNYWDVGFSDSNGSALPHTLPTDGEFQIEIPQIPANSSINITMNYGQNPLSNPNINTTNQSSDMTNISISIGSETTNLGVTFGNTASSHVEYIDDNTINAAVPAHSIGIVNLTITDASGYSAVHDFTYYGISSLSPSYGVPSGGTNVTATGAGFDDFTHYRMPITITNPTSSTITNSAVNVSLPAYNETGLIASWHLEENVTNSSAPSPDFHDSSGNGWGAICVADCPIVEVGVLGNGQYFNDGNVGDTTQGIQTSLNLSGETEITLSLWINPASLSGGGGLVTSIYGGASQFGLGYDDIASIEIYNFTFEDVSGGIQSVYCNAAVCSPVTNEWHHIAVSLSANNVDWYYDGILVESDTVSFSELEPSNQNLRMGGRLDTNVNLYYKGSIDEVKIYERALGSNEILQLHEVKAEFNYSNVQFKNETGRILNHSLDANDTFRIGIPTIVASSSQMIYANYGRHVISASAVSASLQAVVGAEDANAVNLSLGGIGLPSATMINSTTLQFITLPHTAGFANLSISDGSKSFTLTNAFRFSDCISGNSTQDRWGCPDTDGDGYSDPDPTGISGPVWNISDGADNCVNIANANQSDYDSDLSGDVCDSDDDGDSISDESDSCSLGALNWTSNSTTDIDGDGCKDDVEDTPFISYPQSAYTFTNGTSITSLSPTNTGTSTSNWSISPSLAGIGLSFGSSNGTIWGTPTTLQTSSVQYTIAANNSFGNNSTQLGIIVNDAAPNGVIYYPDVQNFTRDEQISDWTPSVSGGAPTSWAISPGLPSGLAFNSGNGTISGTPTVNMTNTTYTIWANNSGGSDSANISITINEPSPSISASQTDSVLTRDVAMTDITFSNSGGVVAFWEISPGLPSGLSLNSGTISGTPAVNMTNTTYTIWANNSGGSDSVTISITINEPSASISYPGTPFEFIREMTYSVSPSTGGGAIDSWGMSPDLPSGLSFNSGNGTISGTPTVNMSNTTYTVWAINSGGNTSITITIVVNEQQAVLTPSQSSATLTRYSMMSDITFSNGGGAVASWEISPGLPSGLSFNHGNGTISGTPTANMSNTTYIVWANNSGGNVSVNINIMIVHPLDPVSYPLSDYNLTTGSATVIIPDLTGAGVHSWEISPLLPAGLTLDAASGEISGTPSV
ncbi:MAG: hypothetical protein CXX80_09240, partial [Methanobacteriota archaeon]